MNEKRQKTALLPLLASQICHRLSCNWTWTSTARTQQKLLWAGITINNIRHKHTHTHTQKQVSTQC